MLTDVLTLTAGVAMIAFVLVDIFQTLFNPQRVGSPSQRLLDTVWLHGFASRRLSPGKLVLVGPLFILTVFILWTIITVLGWALIYHAYLPGEATSLSVGMNPEEQTGIIDAIYFSGVIQTTLGFGDITPRSDLLRFLVPLHAGLGFVMLTAGITWVLGIYPALVRRQQFTHLLYALEKQLGPQGFGSSEINEEEIPALARELANHLATALSDLLQFPITFYFHSNEPKTSLPDAILYLPKLVESARQSDRASSASLGMLDHALEDFSETLVSRFPLIVEDDDILGAYSRTAGYADDDNRWTRVTRNDD